MQPDQPSPNFGQFTNQTPPVPTPPPGDDPRTKVSSELAVMQPGEVVILEMKRHPIGIIGIYIAIVFVLTVVGVLAFALLPGVLDSTSGGSSQINKLATTIFLVLTFMAVVYALVVTKVYWGNRWILTSDSVTQIEQTSLFSRQSSQLALSNIEDVTAEQNGILTHIFNYGVIKAETAGHHGKFVFLYAPNPNYYAQKILGAREALVASGRGGGHH
jgi:hypothetical protein